MAMLPTGGYLAPDKYPVDPGYTTELGLGPAALTAQNWQGEMARRQQAFQGREAGLQRGFQGQQAELQRQFETGAAQAGYQFQGEQAGLQRTFQGQQAEAERGLRGQEAQLGYQASIYPAQQAMARWQQVFPYLQGQYSQYGQGMGAGGGPGGPGQSPAINVGPVWNDQQVQQQVNAQRGANDQAVAGRTRAMQQQLAGRGYGANSPLAMALQGQMGSANLATNTANERETRMKATSENAQHVLQTQQAREGQYATRQQEDISRQGIRAQQQNALLAALAGLA